MRNILDDLAARHLPDPDKIGVLTNYFLTLKATLYSDKGGKYLAGQGSECE